MVTARRIFQGWLALGIAAAGAGPSLSASPLITELMPSNATTIADQDGDYADWLEIYNPDATAVDLGGWYLTNKAGNLTKWKFPSLTLQPGAYLVVFCSSKNYTDPAHPLATTFNLSDSGGYVGLVSSDGATVVSSYTFPALASDISYGVTQPTSPGESPKIGALAVPTPGANNGGAANLLLAERVTVGAPAGIFLGTTQVTLSGATGSEHIRYTLSAPSSAGDAVPAPTAASLLYTGPIAVGSTQLLRAAVFSTDDAQRGLPSTAMYVQLDTSTANHLDGFSSNLPVVVFDDNGFGLLPGDDTYYPGWIGAFSPQSGGVTTLTQTPDFFTPDTMKLHGFSSADFPKQSYDVSLADDLGNDVNEAFFGLDSDKSWAAVSAWNYDRTHIHNALVYSLSRGMGYWASSIRFAEMFIHSGGGPLDASAYAGITAVSDRIKVGSNRVNIFSLSTSDVTAPNVTGGYILRIDHLETDLYNWTTNRGAVMMVEAPKLDELVPAQSSYISGYVQRMEDALVADQASGYATRNYLNFLDRASWVDYHLLNVFVENVDSFQYSEYFTKDVNGLIKAGPVWDYDRSLGSADGRDSNPQQWTPTTLPDFWNIGWWQYLTHDPDFMQAWVDRWQSLRLSQWTTPNLANLADTLAAQIGPDAAARDAIRWPDNQSRFPGGWSGEIANLKSWLAQRADWIDAQFVAPPTRLSVGASSTLTPAPGAQVAYTLDGSDPRLPGGAVASTAILSSGPVTLSNALSIGARSYNASLAGAFPGSPWSSEITAKGVTASTSGQLVNVSCRTQAGSGGNVLVGGFVCSGPAGTTKQFLIRGIGPALTALGVSGVLAQPVLSVYDSASNLIATDTGWSTNTNAALIQATAAAVGAFALPQGSADSALLLSLAPGAYTVQVAGLQQSTGVALVEAYQVAQDNSQVINVSSRALVQANSGPLIAGFVVTGGAAQVLVRGSGPALTQYNVSNVLALPMLQVYDAAGKLVASNAGWSTNANADQIVTATATVGAFPLVAGSGDSAVLLTLPAGAYTAQISGVGGTSGNALAECYLVPSN